jgi:phospholipid-translocating ATPase
MSFMPKASSTRGKIATFYAKVAAFSIEDIFSTKREPGPPRTIYVNEELPQEWLALPKKQLRQYTYSSNQVITSKYTIITFLPRNLLEQFRRVANMCVFVFILLSPFCFC